MENLELSKEVHLRVNRYFSEQHTLDFRKIGCSPTYLVFLTTNPYSITKTPHRFPCLYYITHFSTKFSDTTLYFSAKIHNILHPFTFPPYTITETPDFCLIVYFCVIVRFSPQSPCYQRHQKTPKSGVHPPL